MIFIFKKKGFTLVELLVSIAILAVIVSLGTYSVLKSDPGDLLGLEAKRFGDKIQWAQVLAFSQKEVEDKVPEAYGVFLIAKDKYTIYADFNDNCSYDSTVDQAVETIQLEKKVKFSADDLNKGLCFKTADILNNICLDNQCPAVNNQTYTLIHDNGRKNDINFNIST